MLPIVFLVIIHLQSHANPYAQIEKLETELKEIKSKNERLLHLHKFTASHQNDEQLSEILIYLTLIKPEKLKECQKLKDEIAFAGRSPTIEKEPLSIDVKKAIAITDLLCL